MRPTLPLSPESRRRWRRSLLWGALVVLLVVAQSLLLVLTVSYESTRAQEATDEAAAAAAVELRQKVLRAQQGVQALSWSNPSGEAWRAEAGALLRNHRELLRVERRSTAGRVTTAVDSPFRAPLFSHLPRESIGVETELACGTVQRLGAATFSRSYFVPQAGGLGMEVIDLCVPQLRDGGIDGFAVASFSLGALIEEAVSPDVLRRHELAFVESDGTRLARGGVPRGTGVFVTHRIIDMGGMPLQLRVDSATGSPQLIPNLPTALVMGLSLALLGVVFVLARDVRRRARAEATLAESLAFRKAMEDSVVTGLRARDLEGRITYVNPAFCAMVGLEAHELIGQTAPPYWPPELADFYLRRQQERLSSGRPVTEPREGHETTFVRRNGERFPVVIYEAPLVDRLGRQTGWMSTVLDVSAQRRVEELSRQQQERLQATARLATVGEMASLLSHELNQPLAAIASYATGSLNLLDGDAGRDPETLSMLRYATQHIAEQAERAGRVIKSVHSFVRRREQAREAIAADRLLEAVLPLMRLQARKSGARIEIDVPTPAPRVVCDRTMVEQVVLNLARNGIQAMEQTPAESRVLLIEVRVVQSRWVRFAVIDRGAGVSEEAARQLFTPFFTTRSEGMGLGLSLCRTVIEQHGGALDHENRRAMDGTVSGAEFRFTLPADLPRRGPRPPASADTPVSQPQAAP